MSTIAFGFIGFKATDFAAWDSLDYISKHRDQGEWTGLYIAEDEATAKGYLSDKINNSGNGIAYLHKVSVIRPGKLITCLDQSFKTGNIDIPALKQAMRDKGINVEDTDKLTEKLGQLGYYFRCFNNEDGAIEMIIPVELVTNVDMQLYKTCIAKSFVFSCQ